MQFLLFVSMNISIYVTLSHSEPRAKKDVETSRCLPAIVFVWRYQSALWALYLKSLQENKNDNEHQFSSSAINILDSNLYW